MRKFLETNKPDVPKMNVKSKNINLEDFNKII